MTAQAMRADARNSGVTPCLDLVRVRLTLRMKDSFRPPPFLGSTIRGAFGHVFKRCVCGVANPDCGRCLVGRTCPYLYVFETPVPDDAAMMRLYPQAPHPFVIEPPRDAPDVLKPGESLEFALVLVGRGVQYLPHFVMAFEEMGKTGLGRTRARFDLVGVSDDAPGRGCSPLYDAATGRLATPSPFQPPADPGPAPSAVRLRCLSPMRLRYDERLVSDLEFHILMRNLLRRLSALSYFHVGRSLDLDFTGLIERARQVQLADASFRWVDLERYSGRQKRPMTLGGIVGEATYAGDLGEFLPFLRLGEQVHVGKASSFGFGRYELLAPPAASP